MNDNRINNLSRKLLTGEITAAEKQELEDWYLNFDSEELNVHSALNKEQFADRLYQQISAKAGITPVRRINYYRYAAAASVLLFLTAGLYTFYYNKENTEFLTEKRPAAITPGTDKAILTLANGKKIDLESASKGVIATGDQHLVNKTGDGTIAYDQSAANADNPQYNTLTTPRGGKFSIRLADGTLAILDAASSIRYPSSFGSGKRTVEISGQVYFEVVHNAKKPFIVKTGQQTIEDLGTHFNINAYPGAAIKTTLEEGLVSITNSKKTVFLQPGQAAFSEVKTNEITVSQADIEETLAWKNGYFRFNDEHIENIMEQLARWYDIEVTYNGKLPADGFNGTISRTKNLSQVLKMLERTGIIHFKTEGRRITVLP